VTQYKKGKGSLSAQGKQRADRKRSGCDGQTKPILHEKAKTTKKIVLRLKCAKRNCRAKECWLVRDASILNWEVMRRERAK
jgi:large subunit ribosomal protein L44e